MTPGPSSRGAPATPARRAALDVLGQLRRGRRLDLALSGTLADLPREARPWLHEVVYGTVRLRGRLDHLLDGILDRGVGSVPPPVLDLLRLGAYQLLKMESVPAYAAVSETVEQARAAGGQAMGGLVNAVLRRVAAVGEDPSLFPDPDADPAGWLSTWGSHPRWLVDRWLGRLGRAETEALVEWNNRIPPTYLRPLGVTCEEAVHRLAGAGIGARPANGDTGCLLLDAGADPVRALETVPGVVQDPAAALVTRFAAPPRGAVVADLCAAPGGKCLALVSEGAYVLAADRSITRLRLLREAAERLGFIRSGGEATRRARGAGAVPPEGPTGRLSGVVSALAEAPPVRAARVVLLDVPCTGTGTLRRHPDARWRLGPEDPASLAATQRRILEGAAAAVAPGGHLVYATCTLEPEENEEQVRAFLERHPEFMIDPGGSTAAFVDEDGFLRVTPWQHGLDGAFAARLRRAR